MKLKAYKKQEFFFAVMLLVIFAYVIFMSFIFKPYFSKNVAMDDVVKFMSSVSPMLENMKNIPGYDNYWGVFYSVFWIGAWLFPVLGYMSTFCLDDSNITALMNKPWAKLIYALCFMLSVNIFIFIVPEVGRKVYFNEMSDNFVVLLFTCIEIAGSLYGLGLFVGLIKIKIIGKSGENN